MSFSYNYYIDNTSNLANKNNYLTTRINIDSEIIAPLISVVYSAPNIVVTFSAALTGNEYYIVHKMVNSIYYGQIVGIDYEYNNYIVQPTRMLFEQDVEPTSDYDIYSGYNFGSVVYNTVTDTYYMCINGTTGNAVWIPQSSPKLSSSVNISSVNLNANATLTNWTGTGMFFNDLSINTSTGVFTVPRTGKYSFKININYLTPVLTVQLGASTNPSFILRRTSPTADNMLTCNFPVLDVNILLLITLRVMLRRSHISIVGDLNLNAGDTIDIFYNADGFPTTINCNVNWSIKEL